jgi:anthranilate 1,2-dioxygenase small subunit
MSMTSDLDRNLVARLRADALMAEYVHAIDSDRLEDWPNFFTQDCSYRITTRENHDLGLPLSLIICRGRGMLIDRISALRTANIYEPHVYSHVYSALLVTEVTDRGFSTQSTFQVVRTVGGGDMSVFVCGRCYDRVVEEDGVLKFAERTFVLDSRQIDTLLVIPL